MGEGWGQGQMEINATVDTSWGFDPCLPVKTSGRQPCPLSIVGFSEMPPDLKRKFRSQS